MQINVNQVHNYLRFNFMSRNENKMCFLESRWLPLLLMSSETSITRIGQGQKKIHKKTHKKIVFIG